MDIQAKIEESLPSQGKIDDAKAAITCIESVLSEKYKVQLHGSWYLELASSDSDVDISVVGNYKQFPNIMTHLRDKIKEGGTSLHMRKLITAADVKVIPLVYKGKNYDIDIDLTLQTKSKLSSVIKLRDAVNNCGYHNFYRALRVILRANNLYGHKVGGLNSFSINWMIFAMIEFYRTNSNLLDLHPDWFSNPSNLYTCVVMFCKFYLNVCDKHLCIKINPTDNENGKYDLQMESIQYNFDNWKDVTQPWLLRLFVDGSWVTSKAWRYDHVIVLYKKIVGNQ
jgi:DNA polymerase sigma